MVTWRPKDVAPSPELHESLHAPRQIEIDSHLLINANRDGSVRRGDGAVRVLEAEQVGANVHRVVAGTRRGDAKYIFDEPGGGRGRPSVSHGNEVAAGAVGL